MAALRPKVLVVLMSLALAAGLCPLAAFASVGLSTTTSQLNSSQALSIQKTTTKKGCLPSGALILGFGWL